MSTKERYLGISFKPVEQDLIDWKEKERKKGSLTAFVKQAIRDRIARTESGRSQQSDILHAIEEYQNRTHVILQEILLLLTGDTKIVQEKKQRFFMTEAENLLDQKCAEAGWE